MLEEKTKELGYKVGVRPPARPPRDGHVTVLSAPARRPPGPPAAPPWASAPLCRGDGIVSPSRSLVGATTQLLLLGDCAALKGVSCRGWGDRDYPGLPTATCLWVC